MKRHLTVKPVAWRATTVSAVVVVAVCVAAIGAGSASALTAPDTTTGLTVSTTSTTAGQTITLTATVTGVGGAPPGMVEFDVNAIGGQTQIGSDVTLSPISGTQSQATLDTSFATGTYTVTATYRPDPASVFSFSTSTSDAVLLTIGSNQGAVFSTNLALSAAPDAGTPNTEDLTAHVSQVGGTGVPTGDVTFYANGVLLGQTTLVAGTATLAALSFIPGTYVITASYLGDANDLPVAAIPLTLAITGPSIAVQTTTTASATPSRITAGLAVVLNAHVAQVGTATQPVGNVVIFYANGNRLGQTQVDPNGNASLTVDGWLTGSYTITAAYIGDINDLASAVSFGLNVSPIPTGGLPVLTVTPPSASITYGGTPPALTPGYSGFVSGDGNASLVSPAVCTTNATSTSPAGSYPTTCSGAVDPNYTIVYSAAGTLTVNRAALTVTAANATMVSGQAVPTLTATIAGFQNGETLATSGVSGSASCTTTATSSSAAGTYPITCTTGTLAAANYTFTFVAGTLTVTASSPAVVCTGGKRSDNGHDWDWWHDRNHGSHCESLLADPSPDSGSTVSAGQKLTIVYSDENQIGTGVHAPSAVLSDGQVLPITVTQTSHQPLHYVDNNGGSPSSRYQSLLTFKLPSNLAAGWYSILVTAYDSTGNLDQWIWQVRVGKPSGHDNDNNCDWQSIFSRLLFGRGWISR